jgi:hypothetical protein
VISLTAVAAFAGHDYSETGDFAINAQLHRGN